jgi:hypothetical protein
VQVADPAPVPFERPALATDAVDFVEIEVVCYPAVCAPWFRKIGVLGGSIATAA